MKQDQDRQPITEDWLKSIGFRWHQLDRQPAKQWVLWLGCADCKRFMSDDQDIGLELSPSIGPTVDEWHCWLRSDYAHRYGRFIHIRPVRFCDEVVALIEALGGVKFDPVNVVNGSLRTADNAKYMRESRERLDWRIVEGNPKWSEREEDDARGRALPEHIDAAIEGGKAK